MATRILICRSNPIDPDPRVEKTATALATDEYQVIILGSDRTGVLPSSGLLGDPSLGIVIHRLPIEAEYGHGLANLPNLLRWQWGLIKWLVNHRQAYDLIHACDFDTIIPALFSKLLLGKKIVYDIFDFYADHLRATPSSIKRLIRWVDLRAIGWADALILADETRYEQIAGAKPKRSTVIYNTPTTYTQPLKKPPHLENSFRLAYVGLLQVERGLLEILKILEDHPDWRLDLAGYGGDEAQILAKTDGMPNVHYHGRVEYDRALQISQSADVLFATYDPEIPNHRYASPNKVFEAMMLAKPIIVAQGTNMDRIVGEANCGLAIPYGDLGALETAIRTLASDACLRAKLGENGFQAYQNNYSWDLMRSRLLELYKSVIGEGANLVQHTNQ